MELKRAGFTFTQANQDIAKSKYSPEIYYEAQHIRLTTQEGSSTGIITNEKGNEFKFEIPEIVINRSKREVTYGNKTIKFKTRQKGKITDISKLGDVTLSNGEIIGHIVSRDGIVLFVTDHLKKIDSIFEVTNIHSKYLNEFELNLLYVGKLDFSKNNPITAIYNYENENIQKVYWVDGYNQLRYLNIKHDSIEGNSLLINQFKSLFDFVGEVKLSQPKITGINYGGEHTTGMIQYSYNLYNLNGSETKISPLTDLVPLTKGDNLGGGEIDEKLGASPIILIEDIDTNYDYIKIYAVKYTSLGQLPRADLIFDQKVTGSSVEYVDDGIVIESLSLEEFIFLGNNPIYPKNLVSKDNRLIVSNIKEKSFDIPKELDTRCYSYDENGEARILNNSDNWSEVLMTANSVPLNHLVVPDNYAVDPNQSSVNADYRLYKYDRNGNYGGEGKYLKYNIVQRTESDLNGEVEDLRFFKDEEIYRIGIIFHNRLGQESLPNWIADFVAPEGNLEGNYNTLTVEPKQSLIDFISNYNWKNENDKPVGFSIVRADRTERDKTRLYSGILSDFVIQVPQLTDADRKNDNIQYKFNEYEDTTMKVPSWLIRHYEYFPYAPGSPLQPNEKDGGLLTRSNHGSGLASEIYNEQDPGYKRQYAWIHNKMMQMYSPEIIFNKYAINLPAGLNIQVKGVINLDKYETYYWGQLRNTDHKTVIVEGKQRGSLSPHVKTYHTENLPNNGVLVSRGPNDPSIYEGTPWEGYTVENIKLLHNLRNDNSHTYGKHGFIMPSWSKDQMMFDQYFRKYDTFIKAENKFNFPIYGRPEFAESGKSPSNYNKDGRFNYSNSLESIMSDSFGKGDNPTIVSVNSYNNRNITMVLGRKDQETKDRDGLRDLYIKTGLGNEMNSSILYAEIVKPYDALYTSNIYGGNSFEAKKRTDYIKIGDYSFISYNNGVEIESYRNDSPGDTFVQDFKFSRIVKTDKEIYDNEVLQITEQLSYPTETTIDLKNRNDLSLGDWDARWQPSNEDSHKYNHVYSQQSTLITASDVEHTFRRVRNFDTRLQASRVKYSNEVIDSWTRLLANEFIDLKGEYGPVNSLQLFQDKLYTFQDKAIAGIQVNPRVQIATEDGVGLELGTGGILSSFQYLTTESGSVNHFGITTGNRGIYYYDALNNGVGRIPNEMAYLLSESKGMKSFFNKNKDFQSMMQNNPVTFNGALFGSDLSNNDIFMTLLINPATIMSAENNNKQQNSRSFTWVYNEATDSFVDLKTYKPSRYISKDDKLLITIDNKKVYEQYAGKYNEFFGEHKSSYITLLLNPDANMDKVFTNILYNSELSLNDIDQPEATLTNIHAWNEYQDTGSIPLELGRTKNLRRKFRNWNADIPRDGRNRIRNPWTFLKLELINEEGYKMILHDIIVTYMA